MTTLGLWQRDDVIAALAAGNYGALIKAWRKWTGHSQSEAAARCGLSQPDISELERGRRRATSAAVQGRILDGLGVPPGLRPLPRGSLPIPILTDAPNTDTAARLNDAVTEDRLDQEVLHYLERLLAEHRRIEDRLGARLLLPVVSAQATTLERLARHASGQLHDEALSLCAQYAQFRAWMHHDQRDDASALRLFAQAESQAQEAGDPTMAAHVLSMKAHLAWGAGNPLACVKYAQAAQWTEDRITPGALGMATQMEARGLAILHDAHAADRATDRAEQLLARASANWEDEPRWLYFYDGPWLRLQVGALQLDLGRARRAAETLETALAELNPAYVRDGAWYRAIKARALAAAGDVDGAAVEAIAVLPDAVAINSFALDHLKTTATQLSKRAARTAPVQALVEQLRTP